MPKRLPGKAFDGACTRCPRLAGFLAKVRQKHTDYFCRPVPTLGPREGPLLIVGLAPGLHGANATGRPFTGDHAGIILYQSLYQHGYASKPESLHRQDGLVLTGCRITNAVKCLPPANKPVGAEINQCNDFLTREISELARPGVILALGGIAHKAILQSLGLKQNAAKFGHGAEFDLGDGLTLVSSYHCSRYNTQTKRLTPPMFEQIFVRIRQLTATGSP